MDNYMTASNAKIGVVFNKAIIFMLAIFSVYLICLNLNYSVRDNIGVLIICIFVLLSIFILIHYISCRIKISHKVFAVVIFLLAIVLKVILVILTDTKPVSDFAIFYQYAIKLLNGNKSFQDILYFKTWAYQTGPVIYYAAVMKLFGTGLLPLKIVNCIFMAGTNLLIYLIAQKISNDYTARVVSLLYLLYPAPYFLASVLTNQHFAACMFMLAVYILLSQRLNWVVKGALSGAIIAIGDAIRPIGIIVLVALVIWGIIEITLRKWLVMGSVLVVLFSFLFVSYGCSAMVKHTGINSEGLVNNFPLWKFVIGFNYESKGQYSNADKKNIYDIEDFDERNEVAKQVIKQRLSLGLGQLATLVNEKQKKMWAETDTLRWGFYQKIDGQLVSSNEVKKLEPIILKLEKTYYILIFILMLLGLSSLLLDNKINQGILILSLILLCYFGIHFFIEIQVRYRYFAVIIVFVMAAKGSEMLLCRCRRYRKKFINVNSEK